MRILPVLAPATLTDAGTASTGETILFGVVALITVVCGLGLLTAKRAVSAAANMIGIMIGLAVLYVAGEAPFLGMTQIVVYTGAVMTLVLFVIMMVGIGGGEAGSDAGSSAGRWVIALLGVGLVAVLAAVVWRSAIPSASGLQGGDAAVPSALAGVLFGDHVVTMELTGVLLVIAAVGALTLTHRQRIRPRMTQRDQVDARMRAYAEEGAHPGQKPMPGVYAATNAATAPALSADGDALVESVPRVLRVRDQGLDLSEASPEAGAAQRAGTIASREDATVGRSGMPAMPGAPAPDVVQPVTAPSPQEDAPGEDRSETDPAPAERGNGHSSKEEQK